MIRSHESLVVQVCVRVLVPLIQVYALYVLFHGHYSAGGGFQAGTLLGASLILDILAYGQTSERRRLTERWALLLGAAGVGIYGGIGLAALLAGGNFLDYARLPLYGMAGPLRRSYGILGIEIGVCLAVMAIMASIFYSLVVPEDE